jgi:hypothetical protein
MLATEGKRVSPRRPFVYAGLAMVGHWLRYRAMLGQPGDSISCLDHFCTAGRVVGLDYRRLVRSTREAVQAGVDERDCVCATMTYAIEELEDMMLRAAGHA